MQRRECMDFIDRQEDWKFSAEFMEKGVSGYKVSASKRDAIQEIRALAEKKKFDVLLVFMFDRLGRREDETPFLVQWFIEHGIEVWSTREGQQRLGSFASPLAGTSPAPSNTTTTAAAAPHIPATQEANMINPHDSRGFVSVSDAVPDVLLDIRYHSTYNFVGARINGYESPVALLTREAAAALRLVSDDLCEKGLRLVIYDGYRPQRAVDHFVRWAADLADDRMKPLFYPDVDKTDLFDKGFIARRSGHSRGSTVDLTLLDEKSGQLLDMGGPFDFFGELSHPAYTGVTPEQCANRMLLQSAMVQRGFKPLSTEWWHFTLVNEPYPDTYFDFSVHS